jgi:hypothetical protein
MIGGRFKIMLPSEIVFSEQDIDKIRILFHAGFFNLANGSFRAHFDSNGKIRKTEIEQITFLDKV